jgi:hypothetical protein
MPLRCRCNTDALMTGGQIFARNWTPGLIVPARGGI